MSLLHTQAVLLFTLRVAPKANPVRAVPYSKWPFGFEGKHLSPQAHKPKALCGMSSKSHDACIKDV